MQRYSWTVLSVFLVTSMGCMAGEFGGSEGGDDEAQGLESDPMEGDLLLDSPPTSAGELQEPEALPSSHGEGAEEGAEPDAAASPADAPAEASQEEASQEEEVVAEEAPEEAPEPAEAEIAEENSCDPDPGDRCEVCACNSCAQRVDECMRNAACEAVVDCARRTDCDGLGCLLQCGDEIDDAGGLFSDPVQNAQALGDCRDAHCASEC